jgi:hypothetical protein
MHIESLIALLPVYLQIAIFIEVRHINFKVMYTASSQPAGTKLNQSAVKMLIDTELLP